MHGHCLAVCDDSGLQLAHMRSDGHVLGSLHEHASQGNNVKADQNKKLL